MLRQGKQFYEFDDFRIDVAAKVLWRRSELVPLTQKAFEVLLALVEQQGAVVNKEELIATVWPDAFVEDGVLTQNIYTLRKALGQMADGENYITNLPKRGYRFAAQVRAVWEEERQPEALPRATSVSENRTTNQTATAPQEGQIAQSVVQDDVTAEVQLSTAAVPSRASSPALSAEVQPRATDWLARHKSAVWASLITLVVTVIVVLIVARFVNDTDQAESLALSKLTFTPLTNTGNVTALAMSPDGAYIAYGTQDNPQLGSLWLQQLSTATRRAVLPSSELFFHAVTFSPDGAYLYYVATSKNLPTRTLFRVSVLGGPVQRLLAPVNRAVSFSPDGAQFVYARHTSEPPAATLFVANADGSNDRQIASARLPETFQEPVWSPDGKQIACGLGYAQGNANMRIVTVSVGDWQMQEPTQRHWQRVGQMAWLNDSQRLVFIARSDDSSLSQIWQLDVVSGAAGRITNDSNSYNRLVLSPDSLTMAVTHAKRVTNLWLYPAEDARRAKALTFGAGGYRSYFTWTPDGRIVFDAEAGDAGAISIMNSDGSNVHQLTSEPTVGAYVSSPHVTDDGRYIVFASDMGDQRHIWRMNMDGSYPIQLTYGLGEDNPVTSRDSQWVIYSGRASGGDSHWTLWKVSIDGGEPVQLTKDRNLFPTVSPDGKWIACLTTTVLNQSLWDIAIYPIEGGQVKQIIPQRLQTQAPRWMADGRAITFFENPEGPARIWNQPIAGGNPQLFAELATDRIFGINWSPDGKQLACVRGLWANDIALIRDFK